MKSKKNILFLQSGNIGFYHLSLAPLDIPTLDLLIPLTVNNTLQTRKFFALFM